MSLLIVVRGNSGSGKSSVARALQQELSGVWIEQDYFRRTVLGESGNYSALTVELIEQSAALALNHGRSVIADACSTPVNTAALSAGCKKTTPAPATFTHMTSRSRNASPACHPRPQAGRFRREGHAWLVPRLGPIDGNRGAADHGGGVAGRNGGPHPQRRAQRLTVAVVAARRENGANPSERRILWGVWRVDTVFGTNVGPKPSAPACSCA
ncbi:AAA domain-containing protein [Arthrobacter alpinus]|uniref:AAA domain-containing protein n=1 Tax=Arthrobacter alpinus TaxID=656366 RepID=A0A1H5NS63_9MICC|nr:AAA domain-containing protein [Arthrobacter alpinus]